jgi:hypothetical protein
LEAFVVAGHGHAEAHEMPSVSRMAELGQVFNANASNMATLRMLEKGQGPTEFKLLF